MRYEDIDAVNISTLKELWSRSALHYRHLLDHPREPTDALEFGSACHMYCLERDRFDSVYITEPDWGPVAATKQVSKEQARENKQRRNEWWSAQAGIYVTSVEAWKTVRRERDLAIVSDAWKQMICGCGSAIMRHPVARRYMLEGGEAELPIYWTDEETRVACKGRIDLFGPRATVGLKTARVAAPGPFPQQAAKLGYHLQWAFYHDGLIASGRDPGEMVEIVVEPNPPHDVVVYVIDDDTLDTGREEYRRALVMLTYCRENDDWPGTAPTEEVVFRLPKWSLLHDDDDMSDLDWEDSK